MIQLYSIAFKVNEKRLTIYPFYSKNNNLNSIIEDFKKYKELFLKDFILKFNSTEIFHPKTHVVKFVKSEYLKEMHNTALKIFPKYIDRVIYDNQTFNEEQEKNKTIYWYPFVLNDYIPHIAIDKEELKIYSNDITLFQPNLFVLKETIWNIIG